MKRRAFITLLGGAALAWPLAARAQQPDRVRHIGVLMPYVESDSEAQQWTKAFTQSLEQLGWVEGRNIRLDYRWPGPTTDRLKIDAGELVRSSPDLLVAGSTPAVIALKNETGSIPIVFANVADPVGQGFVSSLLLQFFVNVDCASAANLHSRCTRMKQIWSPPCARRCSPCENE
jgi:putative tryptophan/tyrosine transport system substrate-binding protein